MTAPEPPPARARASALRQLHLEIAALRPRERAWNLLLNSSDVYAQMPLSEGVPSERILSEGVIAAASDPESKVLMSWDIYDRILQVVEAPPTVVRRVQALHRRATLETPTATRWPNRHPRTDGTESLTRLRLNQCDGEDWPTPADLAAVIRFEQDFMDHLRTLKDSGGLGLRRIAKEMEEVDARQVLSKSSLGDLFRKDTVPRNSGQLKVLLHVLLRAQYGPDFHLRLVNRYMDIWRALRSGTPHAAEPEPDAQPELSAEPASWNVQLTWGRIIVLAAIMLIIFGLGMLVGGMVVTPVGIR